MKRIIKEELDNLKIERFKKVIKKNVLKCLEKAKGEVHTYEHGRLRKKFNVDIKPKVFLENDWCCYIPQNDMWSLTFQVSGSVEDDVYHFFDERDFQSNQDYDVLPFFKAIGITQLATDLNITFYVQLVNKKGMVMIGTILR